MKKIIIASLLITMLLITGCGKKEENKETNNGGTTTGENTPVVEEQISYEGLEFLNVGASNGVINTIVINNTGNTLKNAKFTMKIMDANGNIVVELTDEIGSDMETGTTKEVNTKTDADLSSAVSIEYSIVQ